MFYIIDKPENKTSNQVLSEFKKKHNIKKAGFSGVLDPFATGLLIIATDSDTKFLDLFLKEDKTYEGIFLFGKTTDTLDINGNITFTNDKEIKLNELKNIINKKFIGKINQEPPIYSNVKINGLRSHKLARENKIFNLKLVKREIKKFDVFETKIKNEFKFITTVSSGTYIRSLARDIGIELKTFGMLKNLKRTKIGKIDLSKIGEISRNKIIPLNFLKLEPDKITDLLNGKKINLNQIKYNSLVVSDEKRTIWIKKYSDSLYKIYKNIK